MGESGRQPVLGQSQPILKNKHDSLYTEGHADCHSPHRQVRLDFVVHQQVAAAQATDPPDFGVAYRKVYIGVDVKHFEDGDQDVVGDRAEGMLLALCY